MSNMALESTSRATNNSSGNNPPRGLRDYGTFYPISERRQDTKQLLRQNENKYIRISQGQGNFAGSTSSSSSSWFEELPRISCRNSYPSPSSASEVDDKELNFALCRAKRRLIVLGNWSHWRNSLVSLHKTAPGFASMIEDFYQKNNVLLYSEIDMKWDGLKHLLPHIVANQPPRGTFYWKSSSTSAPTQRQWW